MRRELAFELLLKLRVLLAKRSCFRLQLLDPLLFRLSGLAELIRSSPLLSELIDLLLLILFEICAVLGKFVGELAVIQLQVTLLCFQVRRKALVARYFCFQSCELLVCARLTFSLSVSSKPF